MGLTSKSKAKEIKKKNDQLKMNDYQQKIAQEFQNSIDEFHRMNVNDDHELDIKLLKDEIAQLTESNLRGTWNESLMTFSPSGASKCERELWFKEIKAPQDEIVFEPYQKRWVRNGTYIHKAVQRDLVYMEKYLPDCPFEVLKTKEGRFAWERNTRTVTQLEHNGVEFQIYGMMDAVLWHKETKKKIGFDLKTKSTTIASVGDYKLKVPQDNNVAQMVAYSLLFGIDDFLIPYESLAKDNWTKGKEARNDMKTFLIHVTPEMKAQLLDKFARVAEQYYTGYNPAPEYSKCLFCSYKTSCDELERGVFSLE